jgi:hypothetical protein
VTARLQKRGYEVIAPANPLRGVTSDAEYLKTVLPRFRDRSSSSDTHMGRGDHERQHKRPEEPKHPANWLPSPSGSCTVIRAYGGDAAIAEGTYQLPPITPLTPRTPQRSRID